MTQALLNTSTTALGDWLAQRGQPSYRARQTLEAIFLRRAGSFDEITNLPKTLRADLGEAYQIYTTSLAKRHVDVDGTEKLLLQLADGGRIECVLLRDGLRRTICVSSQVGCAMGCVFCASGLDGVDRNLTTGEIVEQALRLQTLLPANERLSHVVVMGMGEPLANLDRLLPALDQMSDSARFGISQRRVTISTVGLPPAMRRLAKENPRYHLAVSLHAPNDELRNRLVPVNKNTGLTEILREADGYFEASGRRLTFEYVLLADVNDQVEHAQELASLLKGRSALINVIPYNPVAGLPYRTPSAQAIRRFREVLLARGLNIKLRQRKGSEINAACGQLRRVNNGLQNPPLAKEQLNNDLSH